MSDCWQMAMWSTLALQNPLLCEFLYTSQVDCFIFNIFDIIVHSQTNKVILSLKQANTDRQMYRQMKEKW